MSEAEVKEDSVMSKKNEEFEKRIRGILKGLSFNVVIRKRDRKKTSFEDVFIGVLTDYGAHVFQLTDGAADSLFKGEGEPVPKEAFTMVGTDHHDMSYYEFNYKVIGESGRIVTSGCLDVTGGRNLAKAVIARIALALESH